MSLIIDTITAHLPGKRKSTPSGWISFNAVCCDDKRHRGGFIVNGGDAVSYHCFNCGFKTSWQPGRHISKNMRKFLRWLNISDDNIAKLSLEALKTTEQESKELRSIIPSFSDRALPLDAEPIVNFLDDIPEKLIPVIEYMSARGLYLEDYPFYWTPRTGFNNRLIIPFLYQEKIVGYTARSVGADKSKYLSEQQPGYVFNLDRQSQDRAFVIVCEGPFDAISIDGCAILGAEVTDSQDWLLKQLHREIVFVPDRDREGAKSVERVLEYGWSVSMPEWPPGVKDVNDAVVKLGRVAALWLIVQAKESYALKVRLRAMNWFKEIK